MEEKDSRAGGKMGGVTHAKLRNVRTGSPREWRFRPDQTVELVEIERRSMQYLYSEGALVYFMHPDTFEQMALEAASLGNAARWLTEGLTLPVEFFEGQAVSVAVPDEFEATVAEGVAPGRVAGKEPADQLQSSRPIGCEIVRIVQRFMLEPTHCFRS